jgi:hypothetical protein
MNGLKSELVWGSRVFLPVFIVSIPPAKVVQWFLLRIDAH